MDPAVPAVYPKWACGGGLHSPAVGTEFAWDLCPLRSRKEWSHEEAPTRRSRKSRAVSRRTSPIMPSAFWSESEWSSVSPPVEYGWRAEAQSQCPELQASVSLGTQEYLMASVGTSSLRLPFLSPGRRALAPVPAGLQRPRPPQGPSSVGGGLTSVGADTLGEHAEGQQGVHEAQKAGGRGRRL